MFKKSALVLLSCMALTACAADGPKIIQPSADMTDLRLRGGMATQIELPSSERVQSVVTGNPSLVIADKADNIVNLVPTGKIRRNKPDRPHNRTRRRRFKSLSVSGYC